MYCEGGTPQWEILNLYGNNQLIPDSMKNYLTFKFKAPELSRNQYESITLSEGTAAITFDVDDIIKSNLGFGSTINIATELAGDMMEKSEKFTGVVVEYVNEMTTVDFKPNDSSHISFSLSPNIESVMGTAAQMIAGSLTVVDTVGKLEFLDKLLYPGVRLLLLQGRQELA